MNLMIKALVISLTFGLSLFSAAETSAQVQSLGRGTPGKVVPNAEEKKPFQTSEEGAIIFRIEDIKPLKNDNDLVDRCQFIVTVFNRMDKEVKEASLDFIWKDNISAKYKIEDDDVKPVAKPEDALTIITKAIMIENILPHTQKSFEFEVETDKCFLLLDQLEYKVTSCIADGDKILIRNNRRIGNGSCTNRFDYINSKNPEYYSEFKDIPESVLQQQLEEQKQAELAGVNKAYKSVIASINDIHEELDKIIKMPEDEEDEEAEENEENKDGDKTDKSDKDKNKKSKVKKDQSSDDKADADKDGKSDKSKAKNDKKDKDADAKDDEETKEPKEDIFARAEKAEDAKKAAEEQKLKDKAKGDDKAKSEDKNKNNKSETTDKKIDFKAKK